MYTIAEISDKLKVSDRTVRNWIDRGILIAYKLGNSYRVSDEDFKKFIENAKVKGD